MLLVFFGITILSACSKRDIRDHLINKRDACQVVTYNAPLTGYKNFYGKKVNDLGYATSVKSRMFTFFGDTDNYDLNITFITPIHARLTGTYYFMSFPSENDSFPDEGVIDYEALISWDAYFDPYTRDLIKITDANADDYVRLELTYDSGRIVHIYDDQSIQRSYDVTHDLNGNITTIYSETQEGMEYTYSDKGAGKQLHYDPAGYCVGPLYSLVEMLDWAPTNPNRERISALGISGDAEPGGVQEYYEYMNQTYDPTGKQTGWNATSLNIWDCRNFFK
jgi:hypothetical protein